MDFIGLSRGTHPLIEVKMTTEEIINSQTENGAEISELPVENEINLSEVENSDIPENTESNENIESIEETAALVKKKKSLPPEEQDKVNKRISELTKQIYQQKNEADELRSKLLEIESKKNELPVNVPPPPHPKDYEDWREYETEKEAYYSALDNYQKKLGMENDEREKAVKVARYNKELSDKFLAKVEEYAEVNPDVKTVLSREVDLSPIMVDAIKHSDYSVEIAYYLAENPAEATRISSFAPLKAALALGKLEAKFSLPEVKGKSKSPPPTPPLSGVGIPVAKKYTMKDLENTKTIAEFDRIAKAMGI